MPGVADIRFDQAYSAFFVMSSVSSMMAPPNAHNKKLETANTRQAADVGSDHALAQVVNVALAIAKDRSKILEKLGHALDENDIDEVIDYARRLTGRPPLTRQAPSAENTLIR